MRGVLGTPLSSFENSLVKRAASLALRKHREAERAFLAEGTDLVAAALAAGRRPQAVFVTEGSAAAAAAETDPGLAGLEVHLVTRRVAEKLTTLQTPPEVMAVFPLIEPPSLELLRRADLLAVYADRVADPGNMGTLVRAAAAFAAAALIASPGCVDLYSPKVVRGSMGAVFALPLYREVQLAEAAHELGAARVYGLVAHDGAPLWSVELVRPALVCVGAERAGLGDLVLRQVSDRVTIPLAEGGSAGVESLNAGVAGAVALYEFARRAATGAGASRAMPAANRQTSVTGADAGATKVAPASPRSGRRRPAEGKE